MVNERRTTRWQIGAFVADTERGELLKEGERVNIQNKPFELLRALLESPNDLVPRDELYKRLWAGVNADYRRGLDTAVKKLRRALGDSERDPKYIETLPRRGYRLIARVHPAEADSAATPPAMTAYPRPPAEVAADSPANRFYLQGYHCWNKRTPAAIRNALSFFEKARDLEPGNSRFWTAIAHAFIMIACHGIMRPVEAVANAREAAAHALSLNPAEVLAILLVAWTRGAFDYDLPPAAEALERRIAAEPQDIWPTAAAAFILIALGRFTDARARLEAAHTLDPVSPTLYALRGYTSYFAGDLAEAERHGRAAIQRDPEFGVGRFYFAQTLLAAGNHTEAIEQLEAADRTQGTWDVRAMLGYAHAMAGHADLARQIERRLEHAAEADYVDAYHHAILKDALGDRDAAVKLLERAVEDHCHWFAFAAVDPRLRGLRENSRVLELTARLRP
ncbi:MAG TPA: winged helix-turn-helix domain-containing protein [Bryobacteraceae bacterium]|nr:winged helix-turn-helix domain-containing protein [Bryobacteraceae bacterium]